MENLEFMRIPLNLIPDKIISTEYQLHNLVHNYHIYVRIEKDMYGLPQASILANCLLVTSGSRYIHGQHQKLPPEFGVLIHAMVWLWIHPSDFSCYPPDLYI
jgi:hypothetical protein